MRSRIAVLAALLAVVVAAGVVAGGTQRTWQSIPTAEYRANHVAVLLEDGNVLAATGWNPDHSDVVASSEIFDPATQTWSPAASLEDARSNAAAAKLPDGRVLVVGGGDNGGDVTTAEIYDPDMDDWTDAGDPLAGVQFAAAWVSAISLTDGRVLVVARDAAALLYDANTEMWTPTNTMNEPRGKPFLAQLEDGRVLAAGGFAPEGGDGFASAEVWDPVTGDWTDAGALSWPGSGVSGTRLEDGRVLVIGGSTGSDQDLMYATVADIYDPASGEWQPTSPLNVPRAAAGVALLADGRVVIVGGLTIGHPANTVEVYDPSVDRWYLYRPMEHLRWWAVAIRLADDSVLVTGSIAPDGGSELLAFATLPLFEGWNELPAWDGPFLDDVAIILEYLDTRVAPAGAWKSLARFFPGGWQQTFSDAPLPDFNTLTSVAPDNGYWLFVNQDAELAY